MNLTAFLNTVPETVPALVGRAIPTQSKSIKLSEGQGRECMIYDLAFRTMYATNDPARTLEICTAANNAKCDPPLDDAEFHHAVIETGIARAADQIAANPDYKENADQDFTLEPTDFTDVGEALLLAREYSARLRHCPATKYIIYNGQVWEENAAASRGCLHELTERQLEENTPAYCKATQCVEKVENAVAAVKQGGSDADKAAAAALLAKAKKGLAPIAAYQRFILKCRDSVTINGIMTEAQTPLAIRAQELDKKAYLLNTPGGEVDLRTGTMHPHNPENFHTKMTEVTPGTEGAQLWADHIARTTCNDSELAEYLQLIHGEVAVGKVLAENLIIAYGDGQNGKSTLFNTTSRVLGDYAGQISAETLTTGRKNGKNWELGELRGKRMIIAPELEEGTRLDASFVKKICSTDKIGGEKKYKDPFVFTPSHTTILYTNHLPKIGSSDAGTWRRLIVVPFNAVFTGKSDIKNYSDYLFRNAGGAVLAWIVEGARKFIAAGGHIEPPECVKQAIDQYRADNDWLKNFITECVEVDKTYTEKSGDLYNTYRYYCDRNGEYIRTAQDFKAAMEGAGFAYRRMSAGVLVYGCQINDDFLKGGYNH